MHYILFLAYNMTMKNRKKLLSILLTTIAVGSLGAAGILWVQGTLADQQADTVWENLRTTAQSAVPSTAPEPTSTPAAASPSPAPQPTATPAPTPEPEPTPDPAVVNPYKDSYLANSDMAAWLQIPDTVIDYPVMWTPEDETFYLYRDFEGNQNKNGCLLLDTDSSLEPLTTNLIIHGHNMRSGAMFGKLTDYEAEDFYHTHKQIILYTPECQRNYEVIAVFRSQVFRKSDDVFKFYKFFQANTQEEFDDFYQNIKEMSLYDTGVTAQFGDHFLTLSTCVYHVEQGRFVVVAKEVESGEHYLPLEDTEEQ